MRIFLLTYFDLFWKIKVEINISRFGIAAILF